MTPNARVVVCSVCGQHARGVARDGRPDSESRCLWHLAGLPRGTQVTFHLFAGRPEVFLAGW